MSSSPRRLIPAAVLSAVGAAGCTFILYCEKLQFLPALMALDVAVLVGLIVLTFLFGRLYCSIICPLGVMQDLFAWIGKKQKKNRYSYSPEKKGLRYTVLAVFVAILILAAVITPTGDPFTLLLVTLPVYLLYELSIFVVRK